jgi:outer membrane receptor protein involved in Fe transport
VLFAAAVLALLAQAASAQSTDASAHGIVLDTTGAPVAGARVEAVGAPECRTTSALDGTYSLPCARSDRLRISAPGFRARDHGTAADGPVVLEPLGHNETVLVTASRSDQLTTSRAAPVSVITGERLALAPAVPLDDVLRSVPGFSLFRRSSSRVSNPTTQGATLRGLAASGASRALVLADGLALNDPFGGWVAWTRVPQASIERVEVLRGGASDLYGADALAGVVQVLTTRPTGPVLRGEVSGASRRTARTSMFAGTLHNRWEGTASAEAFTTRGYVLVPGDERGAVDVPAGGRYGTARASVGYYGARWHLRTAAHLFAEERENGTVLQTNETGARQVRVDAGGDLGGGQWRATAHAGRQTYRQVFSALAADRSSETLTQRQRVPASERGASAEWSRASGRIDILLGGDVRQTTATNHEQGYFPDGRPRTPVATPAFQRTGGVFGQVVSRLSDDVTLTLGARGDLRERERSASLDDADTNLSPRISVAWAARPAFVFRGSAAWSFRAPTLNERFRGFRVGSVETRPNPLLQPEALRTIEAGALYAAGAASVRMTAFRADLSDAITNVTVSVAPTLITRRRENVGGVRVWGLELEGDWPVHPSVELTGSAAVLDSRFVDDPVLDGLRVPQVPRWQMAGGARWRAPRAFTAAIQLRAFGRQFEDDRNTLVLGRGAVADLTILRPAGRGASLLVGVENLFNARYEVGRTPTRTLGQPIAAHISLRFTLTRDPAPPAARP